MVDLSWQLVRSTSDLSVTFDLGKQRPNHPLMHWILAACIGLLLGAVIGWLLGGRKSQGAADKVAAEFEATRQLLSQQLSAQQEEARFRIQELKQESEQRFLALKEEQDGLRTANTQLTSNLSRREEQLKALTSSAEERGKELEKTREELQNHFKVMANSILDTNSAKFSAQNKTQIDDLLTPLKERIKTFEEKVDKKYLDENREREGLKEQIKQLMELNNRLSTDAQQLTSALKGDNKAQGNWGELVLERVLEGSGLRRDHEYRVQYSEVDLGGQRKQPDVVVNLPDDRHVIIDSKVSLVAYEQLVHCDDADERKLLTKQHVQSVKAHIKGLSEKDYPALTGLNAPDFVLLFIPIEASFGVALEADLQLFDYAWSHKIVMVTPSTLLATLRTVASVWQHEKQIKNATDIAREAGLMLDKFTGFAVDMANIGNQLERVDKTYSAAMNKLSQGKGNLISRAQKLKSKGVRVQKDLPEHLIQDDHLPELPADE